MHINVPYYRFILNFVNYIKFTTMVKTIKYFFLLLVIAGFSVKAEVRFDDYFKNQTLRYDFLLGGDDKSVEVYPQQIKAEGKWAGSKTKLIDKLNYGTYRICVFDEGSNELVFSRGFSPLFMEWQTTAEAKKMKRTFYQSAFFPYPKKKVRLDIEQRQWKGDFKTIYSAVIDPDDFYIIHENQQKYETQVIQNPGEPEECVDLVFLAEGYPRSEMDKFISDVKRMTDYLFETKPFNKHKSEFNIYAVSTPSVDSGTDIPGEWIYKNTAFNSTFYTFGTARYLTSSDMKNIYDAAAGLPWDQIFVLVNTERYGGGGFYNFVGVGSVDNELSEKVFVHEFGHAFAGLGDEYYTSEVAYENFYNLDVEPWEPNLTTLVNFESKWKSLLDAETQVPTPRTAKYQETIGVFEGGGYTSKSVYSPMMNCRMKSNEVPYFCPVCSDAIERVIEAVTD